MVPHISDLRTREVKAEGSEIQDHPELHIKFKTSLGYMSRYFIKKNASQQTKNELN